MIITKKEVDYIKKRGKNEVFSLIVDFGQKKVEVRRKEDQAIFNGSIILDLKKKVKDNFCYLLDDQGFRKISFFSEETNRF